MIEPLTKDDIAIARSNGISYDNAYNRYYNLFWDKERAITEPVKPKNGLWTKYRELAEANGVKAACFLNRVKMYGMTPEQAATTPTMTKAEIARMVSKKRQYKAKITKEIRERAEANGISYARLGQRVYRLKWDIERACTEPIGATGYIFGKRWK